MHQAMKGKEFREDLYFRLQVLEIEIPPLRKRSEDLKPLVMEMQVLLKGKETGKGFWEAIADYNWPGNIRELITVLTRAGILLDSPITGTDIREIIKQTRCKRAVDQRMDRIEQIWDDIRAGKSFWDTIKKPFLDRDLNRDEVKEIIRIGLSLEPAPY